MKQKIMLFGMLIALCYSALTQAQTPQLIKDMNQNALISFTDPPEGYLEFNGRVYFTANDSIHHRELRSTDGTSAGTSLVKEINSGPAGQAHFGVPYFSKVYRTIFNNEIYFNGLDSVHGMALWKTDGTASGTLLLKDISQLGIQASPWQESVSIYFNEVNNKLIFLSQDTTHGYELWTTDGSSSGTQLLKDINPYPAHNSGNSIAEHFTLFNNKLYFIANDSTHGNELWVTDGTTSGTQLVVDLQTLFGYTNFAHFNSDPTGLYDFNNELYFIDGAGVLYKTDGTFNGTHVLSDSTNNYSPRVRPQTSGSNAPEKYFTEMNGELYFIGADSIGNDELWKTDGTVAGTTIVKEINPATSSYPGVRGEISVLNGNQLVLFARPYLFTDTNNKGWELWQSDGTANGTSAVKQLALTINNFTRVPFVNDNKLYFNARSANAPMAWWCSDGTSGGTFPVVDSVFLLEGKPIEYNNRMYFVANNRLYESEGDSMTTKIVKPIGDTVTNINLSFSNDVNTDYWNDYVVYNNSLIFTASWGQTGKEPWKLSTIPLKVIGYDKTDIEFSLYPNPTNSVLNIASENKILKAEIFDLQGRNILSTSHDKILVDHLMNGIYIIRITTNEGVGSAKFMIE